MNCIWCWLIPLIVGLICAYLGYLLRKLFGKGNNDELLIWKNKAEKLEADLSACNKSKLDLESNAAELGTWKSKAAKLEADLDASNKAKLELESKPAAPVVDLGPWESKVAKLEAELHEANKAKLMLGADLKSANDNLGVMSLSANNSDDSDALKAQISKLEADLELKTKDVDIWKNKVANLKTDLEACEKSKLNVVADLPFDGDAAKAVFGKKIKQDDLKLVEGIGPKIEGLFHNFDIKTWKALSEASLEKCQEVLNSGGERYKIHNPGTWPKQAELAYEGKWAALLKWQDELDGGKA